MFGCPSHCAVPLAAQEVTGPNTPEMQRQRPPELEELTRLLAYPREALVSLKRQQAAVQAALWEMEQSLTRYQSALSSCSLSWPGYEPAVAKEEEPASVEGHNPMVHVNVDQVMDPEQGHQQEEADEDTPPSCKTHLEDLDASISPHTRRLLKKVREQTTLQKQKSLEIHPSEGLWKRTRLVCTKLIKKDWFECLISFVIVANSAIIGVDSHLSLPIPGETVKGSGLAWASEAEIFFLVFYSVELAIRAIALQSKCFRDGWFIFDAILVTSAYIEQLLSLINVQSEQQIMILRLLRLIRLVRTFRMIRQIKSIWRLLYGLLTCGELLISTLALLGMVIYVFAVLGLETIASNQEMREDDNIQRLLDERFSSLGVTMMTLTQFVTLDSLSSLYLPLIKKNAWLMFYFLGLIIIVSIALMNLVTAVLVEGALEHARQDRELEAKVGMVTAKQMLPGILSLFDAVDQDGSGEIVIEEMEKFEQSGLHTVPPHFLDRASVESMTELFDMLDVDKSGRITKDEFTEGILDIFLREVPLSSLQMMKMLRLLHKSTSELEVMATTGDYSPLSARRPPQLDFEEDLLEVSPPGASPKPSSKPSSFSAGRRPAETPGSVKVSLSRASSRVSKVQQTPVAETDPVDRTTFNQIFSQLTETGELAVERLAEGLEMLEGVGCDKEWIHEILRDQFNGRSFLDRSDFYDFVNMYRNQRFTFMRKIFSEVDQDHSQSVSLQEVVQLLGRRGITPVLSCVERIFREVTGESGLRDLTFEEFVKIYDVVQARAGFSEYDLVRLKKVWSRYDRDGNQLLSADELRVALKWQGFAVDAGVVDSLAQEVADGKGLNQREFLIFMRKYRDQEVQKIMQMGVATKPEFKGRRDHIKVTRETRVQMKDLPMLLSEIGYEEVASEVMQECASLVHLVDLDAARGLPAISHTFSPDCIYEFMEQLRAAHGFTHSERVDMLESFHRFQGEKESCSSFDHDCDTARSGSTISESEAFDLHITVMQLFCALRWLGYPAELWQVQELLDSMELTGAELREEEFIRIMAVVRDREMEGIVKVLKQAEAEPPPPSPLFSPKSPTKKGDPSRRWGMLRKKPAVSNSEFQTRLHRIFHALGYEASPAMLADLEGDFTQGQFSKDRWGVLRALRQHRRRIRNTIRQNFGFLDHELEPLREIFFGFAERLTGKVRGAKQIGKLLKELFEGSETDKDQRQRAQEAIAQATHTTKAENLDFEEFLHLMRICLGQMASALLQQEEVSIQKMSFQQEEIMGFRSIFNRLAVDSRARQPHHVTVHTAVLLVPSASYLAVENELATVAGAYSREARESLQEVLQKMDAAGKGGLYFWEFLEAATALLESNWQNINEEAKKVIVDAWAEKEAEALYSSKPAVMVRTSDLNQTVRPSAQA